MKEQKTAQSDEMKRRLLKELDMLAVRDDSGSDSSNITDTFNTILKKFDTAKIDWNEWDVIKSVFPQELSDLIDKLFAKENNNTSSDDCSDNGQADSSNSQADSSKSQCSKNVIGVDEYQTSDGQCHETPETPKFKLEIEENEIPENWWDKLPDIDPRVYDAISLRQAAACVKYIFSGLDDIHNLGNRIEARKFRKTSSQSVVVPRTKVIKPKEIKYDTKIDDFIKKDQTY